MARDLVLAQGTLIDGTGGEAVTGDLLVRDGLIAAMGSFELPAEAENIDCHGLIVAPGFIDLHSHSDLHVLEGRREKLLQGVTTEVVGNCGFSAFPCGHHREELRSFANGILCGGSTWGWNSARSYLQASTQADLPVLAESLAGHGSMRVAVAGMVQGPLAPAQLEQLIATLDEALADGAVGFSTGLMYAPGSGAPREELLALCKVVARRNKIHCTHMRNYGFHLLEAIDEQLRLAEESGCRLQISHLQAVGKANRTLNARALERVEAARQRGIDVAFDCYPYIAGSTVMTQLLPQPALAGGIEALLARLADPDLRANIAAQAVRSIANGWDELLVSAVASAKNAYCVGMSLQAIGLERGVDPMEAVFQLIEEERGQVNILEFNQSEENLRVNLAHPLSCIISDGFYVQGRPHPRLHGTFPSFLRRSLDDPQWLPLPAAIHKITGKPAERMGLRKKGLLRVGYTADIAVFDPMQVAGPASYEEPEQSPVGIREVIRAGVRRLGVHNQAMSSASARLQ
jgi:dihydroorotase/N-acyl-D-amino-acid deacylase